MYADHISQYVTEPSLLVLDRASCHTSREVRDYIEDFLTADGQTLLETLLLPPKTAFLLSPLDNGAIGAFKQRFYSYDRSTFELKKSAVKLSWDAVSNKSLQNFAIQCGLDDTESLSSIRTRFEENVHGFIPEEHQPSLELFEQWNAGAVLVEGAQLKRGVKLQRPTQLPEGNVIKWKEWGT